MESPLIIKIIDLYFEHIIGEIHNKFLKGLTFVGTLFVLLVIGSFVWDVAHWKIFLWVLAIYAVAEVIWQIGNSL